MMEDKKIVPTKDKLKESILESFWKFDTIEKCLESISSKFDLSKPSNLSGATGYVYKIYNEKFNEVYKWKLIEAGIHKLNYNGKEFQIKKEIGTWSSYEFPISERTLKCCKLGVNREVHQWYGNIKKHGELNKKVKNKSHLRLVK